MSLDFSKRLHLPISNSTSSQQMTPFTFWVSLKKRILKIIFICSTSVAMGPSSCHFNKHIQTARVTDKKMCLLKVIFNLLFYFIRMLMAANLVVFNQPQLSTFHCTEFIGCFFLNETLGVRTGKNRTHLRLHSLSRAPVWGSRETPVSFKIMCSYYPINAKCQPELQITLGCTLRIRFPFSLLKQIMIALMRRFHWEPHYTYQWRSLSVLILKCNADFCSY